MTEWWTYRLSDFLMFSPRTYWRLVELYNRELWPVQPVLLVLGALGLLLAWRARFTPLVPMVLAAAWLWTGWAFAWQRYAPINWGAQYLALACVVQAGLLLVLPLLRAPAEPRLRSRRTGAALTVAGLAYPLTALAWGRPLAQAESWGLMPDPTALVTLGLVLMLPLARGLRAALAAIPLLTLLAGAATHWAMAG